MNIILEIIDENYNLIVVENYKNSSELKDEISNFSDYQSEFSKVKSEKRKQEFLIPRILVNKSLNKEIIIRYNSDGKPYISNFKSNISISHSRNYFAILVSEKYQTGVDIEFKHERYERIKFKYLSANELSNSFITENLDLCWSAKESIYKIAGKSLVDFRKSIEIQSIDSGEIKASTETENFKLKYIKNADFSLTYCLH